MKTKKSIPTRKKESFMNFKWGKRIIFYLFLMAISLFFSLNVRSQSIVNTNLTLEEIIYDADVIIWGRVTVKESKWITEHMIATDYYFEITDTVYSSAGNTFFSSETFFIRLAGGVVGDERIRMGHMPEFAINEEIILFLDQENRNAISPLVGVYQGYLKIIEMNGEETPQNYRNESVEVLLNVPQLNQDVNEFVRKLKESLQIIKRDPNYNWRNRNSLEINQKNTSSEKTINLPVDLIPSLYAGNSDLSQPLAQEHIETESSEEAGNILLDEASELNVFELNEPASKYIFVASSPDAPIVWNIPPMYYESGSNVGVNFEYALSDWNRYSANVHRKITNSVNTYGKNGRFDFTFITPQACESTYGFTLGSTTLAVTWTKISWSDKIVEADILMNVSLSWTTDFNVAYNNSDIFFIRSVTAHEIGHAIGLDHPWEGSFDQNANSLLTYQASNSLRTLHYRPHLMDARAMRHAYGTTSIYDFGIYLYYTTAGIWNVSWSTFPSNVSSGSSFTLSNIRVENLGTGSSARYVTYYLSTKRNTWDDATYYYLGTHQLSSITQNQYVNFNRTLTVPSHVPTDIYYIVADIGIDDNNFNRFAWSHNIMLVSCHKPSIPGVITGSTAVCAGQCPTYAISPVSGATSYTWAYSGGGTPGGSGTSVSFCPTSSGTLSVRANNDCGSSNWRSIEISVTVIPSTPGPISGVSTVCPENTYTYSISPVSGATSYSWEFTGGGTPIGSGTSVTLTPTSSGTLRVSAVNSCGPSYWRNLYISMIAKPATPGIISGQSSVCLGSTQTYSISSISGATSYTWEYTGGGTPSGSGTTVTLTPTSSGTLRVRANNACGSSDWRTMSLSVISVPGMPGPITGPTNVISGSSNTYSISSVSGATSYAWSFSGTGTPSGTGTTVTLTPTSSGTLSVIASNSCGSSSARTLEIQAGPPQTLTIGNHTVPNNAKTCFNATQTITLAGSGNSFVVQSGGVATFIAGQNIRMLPGLHFWAGSQVIAYISPGGPFCGEVVKHFLATEEEVGEETGEIEFSDSAQMPFFKIYPNPTTGGFTLELSQYNENEKIIIEIFGMRGETILLTEVPGDQLVHQLSVEGQLPGLYLVRLIQGNKVGVERIIKR